MFSQRHGIQVITLLYYNMKHSWDLSGIDSGRPAAPQHHQDMVPYSTAWPDCGTAVQAAVEVPENRLATRCETFFVFPDLPHGKFNNEKIKRVLGWKPRYQVEGLWNKEFRSPPNNLHGAF